MLARALHRARTMALIERLFLGCGAMKAGTTWLFAMLDRHPDIFFSDEKEIHYFAHVHGVESPLALPARIARFQKFATGLRVERYNPRWVRHRLDWFSRWLNEPLDDEWYAALFRRKRDQKYVADFSNLNALLDDGGWQHVRRVAGEVRVLYIMRDPLQRLWSHVKFHAQYTGQAEELPNYSPERFETTARAPYMWRNSEYGHIVARLKRHFGEDELKLAFFEDIHANPIRWLRELETFLGVRPGTYNEEALSKRINTSKEIAMPDFFPTLFQEDFRRIRRELQNQGLDPPRDWAGG
jgi:hypothetical protein